jgi:hypothetical protein
MEVIAVESPTREERILADLTVPKEHQPILNKIRMMPEESLRSLVSAFERSPEGVASVQGLSSDEAEGIRQVVMELYRVREFFDMGVSEFVSDIATDLQEVEAFPVAELPALKERLTKLLAIESVSIASKAASLKVEYERRFCSARMLTDARPIYGVDPSKPPAAGMITHTLRISYHDNTSQLREFYVALDGDDIATLRSVLDRADVKAKSLESIFATAKVKIVAP